MITRRLLRAGVGVALLGYSLSAPEDLIKPGECGVYKKGNAKLALCIESAIQWGKNIQQVNGFLVNAGAQAVCDLKLVTVGTTKVDNFWPDWAPKSSYTEYFNPEQSTAVGKPQQLVNWKRDYTLRSFGLSCHL